MIYTAHAEMEDGSKVVGDDDGSHPMSSKVRCRLVGKTPGNDNEFKTPPAGTTKGMASPQTSPKRVFQSGPTLTFNDGTIEQMFIADASGGVIRKRARKSITGGSAASSSSSGAKAIVGQLPKGTSESSFVPPPPSGLAKCVARAGLH